MLLRKKFFDLFRCDAISMFKIRGLTSRKYEASSSNSNSMPKMWRVLRVWNRCESHSISFHENCLNLYVFQTASIRNSASHQRSFRGHYIKKWSPAPRSKARLGYFTVTGMRNCQARISEGVSWSYTNTHTEGPERGENAQKIKMQRTSPDSYHVSPVNLFSKVSTSGEVRRHSLGREHRTVSNERSATGSKASRTGLSFMRSQFFLTFPPALSANWRQFFKKGYRSFNSLHIPAKNTSSSKKPVIDRWICTKLCFNWQMLSMRWLVE